ncbi:type II toxin-antitoxin system VapC family toxin [Serinibacter salmoneus]|uniref:Ribonuclease VapC n=1 Tax=Serinibacter salmoneus TaxID=556530 RepID=A0A2A9D5S7_9MICO|nr:PIN domain nuclease [Serinibacter salmoneus]PFG21199.1 hypothetical protein ATL40_2822 [Serinibacter salmoneus]
MILADTSLWIEFLRGTDSRACTFVREHVGLDLAATEPVLMELLAGSRPGAQADRVDQLLRAQSWCHIDPVLDFRGAADVFHAARSAGRQPRALTDCLIAAIALRLGITLAHRDTDYAAIAATTGLRTIDLR